MNWWTSPLSDPTCIPFPRLFPMCTCINPDSSNHPHFHVNCNPSNPNESDDVNDSGHAALSVLDSCVPVRARERSALLTRYGPPLPVDTFQRILNRVGARRTRVGGAREDKDGYERVSTTVSVIDTVPISPSTATPTPSQQRSVASLRVASLDVVSAERSQDDTCTPGVLKSLDRHEVHLF